LSRCGYYPQLPPGGESFDNTLRVNGDKLIGVNMDHIRVNTENSCRDEDEGSAQG